jgi:hypothetical protein
MRLTYGSGTYETQDLFLFAGIRHAEKVPPVL